MKVQLVREGEETKSKWERLQSISQKTTYNAFHPNRGLLSVERLHSGLHCAPRETLSMTRTSPRDLHLNMTVVTRRWQAIFKCSHGPLVLRLCVPLPSSLSFGRISTVLQVEPLPSAQLTMFKETEKSYLKKKLCHFRNRPCLTLYNEAIKK